MTNQMNIEEREQYIKTKLTCILEYLADLFPTVPWYATYFAGGCIRDLYWNVPVKDYDLFFHTQQALDATVSVLEKYVHKNKPSFITKTPLGNYNLCLEFGNENIIVQFITISVGSKLWQNFDFEMNQGFYQGDRLHLPSSLINRTLWLGSSIKPNGLSTKRQFLNRLIRFIGQGWLITSDHLEQVLEIAKTFPADAACYGAEKAVLPAIPLSLKTKMNEYVLPTPVDIVVPDNNCLPILDSDDDCPF